MNYNNLNNNFGMGFGQPQMGGINPQSNMMNTVNGYNNINNSVNNNMIGENKMKQNMNNNNQQQNKQEEEEFELCIEQQEFDGLLKSKLTTTTDLSKMVNKIFKPVFEDFEGSIVLPNNVGGFDTVIYFRDPGMSRHNGQSDKVKALQYLVQQNNGNLSMSQRLQNLNTLYKNKTYTITKECKDIFKEFMITNGKNKSVNWNRHVVEKTEPNYNGYSIYVLLTGIDIIKVIRKVYGATNKEGNRIDYKLRLEQALSPAGADGLCSNYLVSIMQLDVKEVEKVAQSVGMIPLANTLPIIR